MNQQLLTTSLFLGVVLLTVGITFYASRQTKTAADFYSGGRGFPHATTTWAQAGYTHLVMDTRGQGWQTTAGGPSGTPDLAPEAGLNHVPGVMTSGITDPRHYYYRRVYTDAARLLDAALADADEPLHDADLAARIARFFHERAAA